MASKYWNVSLWVSNDEGLYNLAVECLRSAPNRREAAEDFLQALKNTGVTHTPDGARYSKSAVLHALRGL